MDKRNLKKIDTPLKQCEICNINIPRITTNSTKRNSAMTYLKRRFCSNRCKGLHHSEIMKSKSNPNFKDGLSTLFQILRGSYKYKIWRKLILIRDNYTCQVCGIRNKELQAHHIQSFALFPKLRFDINNGQTLCFDCHKTTHTYGKQIGEYSHNI